MTDLATLVLLNKLMDSADEKPHRGKKEVGSKEDVDVIHFEYALGEISDIISPKERLEGTDPIQSDEKLALTLHFLSTGSYHPSFLLQGFFETNPHF